MVTLVGGCSAWICVNGFEQDNLDIDDEHVSNWREIFQMDKDGQEVSPSRRARTRGSGDSRDENGDGGDVLSTTVYKRDIGRGQ